MKRIQTNVHSAAFHLHPVGVCPGHGGPPQTCANTAWGPCTTPINWNVSLRSCFEQKQKARKAVRWVGINTETEQSSSTPTIVCMCQLTRMQPLIALLPRSLILWRVNKITRVYNHAESTSHWRHRGKGFAQVYQLSTLCRLHTIQYQSYS